MTRSADTRLPTGLARAPAWLQRYRHLNWALADQALISGVNFLSGILLARYLGLEEFGRFTLAWLAVEFLHSCQHALVVSPMMSIGPKQSRADAPAYFGAVMMQQLVLALVTTLLLLCGLVAVALFPDWRADALLLPLGCCILLYQIQNFLRRYFFTIGLSQIAFLNDLVRYGGQLALLVALSQVLPLDAAGALWMIAGSAGAATLLGACSLRRVVLDRTAFRRVLERHWKFAGWLLWSEVMRWGTGNLFIVVAGALLGATAVGAIRAAQNLVGLCHILQLGLENVVPVQAARRLARDKLPGLIAYLRRFAIFGTLGIGAIVAVAAIAPELWLELVYGKAYAGHGYLVQWWAAIYLIGFLGRPLAIGLRTLEQTRGVFLAHLFAALFTVVIAHPIIDLLGTVGVMVGLLGITVLRGAVLAVSFRAQLSQQRLQPA